MAELTTIQEVLLEEMEREIRELTHERYTDGISESDYLEEARRFVRFLIRRYREIPWY
jgi:hypothetical protein